MMVFHLAMAARVARQGIGPREALRAEYLSRVLFGAGTRPDTPRGRAADWGASDEVHGCRATGKSRFNLRSGLLLSLAGSAGGVSNRRARRKTNL